MSSALHQVRGQPLAVSLLERALREQRLAGAYLFAGPAGVGKRLAAEGVVAVLLCAAPGASAGASSPCGACAACLKLLAGVHPDRIEIRLPDDKKEIPVGLIRELQGRLAYPPHERMSRVVVLYDAENLSVSAANALLKTLEEPPGRTHFVLTTEAPHALLPTIRSRCQLVRFAPLPATELIAICTAQGATAERAAVAAALAGGSAARALALLQQEELEAQRARAEDFDRAISGSLAECMTAAQEGASDKGGALATTLELLQVLYRDLLLAGVGLGDEELSLPDRKDELRARAARTPAPVVLARLEALREGLERLEMNANATLVAEWVALRFRENTAAGTS